MAPTAEFEGDDFSNNLFTDLAPLLTLFGEQVTKQFLSMSMGWVDNILLAMGPLGVITIIVSAIRVGGGKTLKALVGRARESQAIAEQEVLSSTSENVCELWNGQQIVRTIGISPEMSVLVVDTDGNCFNLYDAWRKNLIFFYVDSPWFVLIMTLESVRSYLPQSGEGPNQLKSLIIYLENLTIRIANRLDWPFIDSEGELKRIANNAPNISLNIKNATVSSGELWSWAVLGLFIQGFAVAFPRIATDYWGWTKGPGNDYGYPCFCTGSLCLMIGIISCGHIIEGVTTERSFMVTRGTEGNKQNVGFFSYQQARSFGEQQFPRCVISYDQEDGGVLKISSLNAKQYRYTLLPATAMTLVGYILQFIGLRALHWTAAVVQLGVTVVMTAARSWVRRNLASDPETSSNWINHEIAWMTTRIVSDKGKPPMLDYDIGHPRMPRRLRQLISKYYASSEVLRINPELRYDKRWRFWELISGLVYESEVIQNSQLGQLFGRTCGPFQTALKFQSNYMENNSFTAAGTDPFQTYLRLSRKFPIADDSTAALSGRLCDVIGNIMTLLVGQDLVTWKDEWQTQFSGPDPREEGICWAFGVNDGSPEDDNDIQKRTKRQLHINIQLPKTTEESSGIGSRRCELLNRDLIQAALRLSLFANAVRSAFRYTNGPSVNNYRLDRIIGLEQMERELGAWLIPPSGFIFFIMPAFTRPHPSFMGFLGMFVSSWSRGADSSSAPTRDVVVRSNTDAPLHYAQELLSLFILAMASVIEKVNGNTTSMSLSYQEQSRQSQWQGRHSPPPEKRLQNSVFKSIANEIVRGGLTDTEDEAYILIIPAFAHYGLLPPDPDEAHEDLTSQPAPEDENRSEAEASVSQEDQTSQNSPDNVGTA